MFFIPAKSNKFPTKFILVYPSHLKYVAALPWETYNHLHGHIPGDIMATAISRCRKASPGKCVRANGGHFEPFMNKLMQTISIFACFWFKWHLPMVSDFYCVDA